MAKQPESRLQQAIQKAIRKKYPDVFMFKHWGGPFSPAGIPDLIICLRGHFVAFEVKLPKDQSKPSRIQLETIDDIRRAGGCARIVRSIDEALAWLEGVLDDD